MVAFGGETITVVQRIPGAVDELGVMMPEFVRTDVQGCRHRPMVPGSARGAGLARAEKEPEVGVAVATSWWQTTLPPLDNILPFPLTAADTLEIGGNTYVIIGNIHPFTDLTGRQVKVTIHTELQTTG
jgi:hypothetical protein